MPDLAAFGFFAAALRFRREADSCRAVAAVDRSLAESDPRWLDCEARDLADAAVADSRVALALAFAWANRPRSEFG